MKFMAIDGNSLVNRAFYGVRPLSAPDGTPTGAIYGFLNMYFKLLEELSPDGVCVCFDLKAKTFRHEMYDGYKAQRKPMPEELAIQMPLVKEALDLLGVTRLEKEGYEADDLLGTLAFCGSQKGDEWTIVTGDRDSLQYIACGAKVALVTTKQGQTLSEIYDEALFKEKYGGLAPQRLVDLKAIMGDKSDNIPGVPGIGEKGAMDLLKTYGSLEGVYKALDEGGEGMTPSVKKKLAEGRESAFLSYRLAKGVTDAPIACGDDFTIKAMDKSGLYRFLDRLGLKSIIKRLSLTPPKESTVSGVALPGYKTVSKEEAHGLLEKCQKVFCAFSEDMKQGAFVTGGVLWACEDLGDEADFLLKRGGYVIHDGKRCALYMYKTGKEPAPPLFDTAVAAYLLSPTSSGFSLENLALSELGLSLEKENDGQLVMGGMEEKGLESLAKAAWATFGLYGRYSSGISDRGMDSLMYDIEMPLVPILAHMQHLGMKLDTKRLDDFGYMLTMEAERLEGEIYDCAGETFNIGSPRQLGTVLFEKLGLKAGKKTKTGYSTDAETLEKLRDSHRIIGLILEYRKLTKLISTYVEGLLKTVGKDGRVHSTFNQTVTATGRLSSTDPNMQNIPVRQQLGTEIRRCFIPEEGNIFIDADYSQIELRVLAHLAHDETMIKAFNSGEDIHRVTASQVFGVPFDEVTPAMRSEAKAVNFGIVYGISSFSLSQDIGVSPYQAKKYMDAYLEKYHGVRQYMENIKKQAYEKGYVTTEFGRRRDIPELKSQSFNVRSFGERVALNTPVQGTAADIIKKAMINVERALKERGLKASLVLQVHDELILECPVEEKEEAARILARAMESAADMEVPMKVDVSFGENWYEAKA